ncbi:MAG: PQQ-binding-like beta-propeller repeat protein [Phycisphaerales bacterium]|nr:MAG: PQQ-binding-like beta-propeller repeat protein [Phycisphaerales bacterium]
MRLGSQMIQCRSSLAFLVVCVVVLGGYLPVTRAFGQWRQWGGPNRDFAVDTSGLADSWPDGGPKKLWYRTLGTGYSSIVVDNGVLYTMYRTGRKDVHEYTIALDAATGKTIWQKRNRAAIPPETPDHGKEYTGPNATPLIVGDRLYTIGRNATMHCFKKTDGAVLWKHELHKDFGAQLEPCGYSCSPLAYGDTIIVPLGRGAGDTSEGNSLIAFDRETGSVSWRSQTFRLDHSSPILITLGGQDQYVLCTKDGAFGIDPRNGALLWHHAIPEETDEFIGLYANPVWNGADALQFSTINANYGIRLTRADGKTNVERAWYTRKVPMGMGTPALIDGMVVGAKRTWDGAQNVLAAIDIRTGKRVWVKRALPGAILVGDAEKLVFLNLDGQLGLLTATREGLTTHAQCQVTERWSWTAPTLVGTTLYVRDEKHIMALDLSR